MRRNRIVLLILWLLSLVCISFYGGVISYGFFAFFTLVPLMSLIYILFVYLFFKIYQNLEGRDITCGRTSLFYFTLQNESFIALSGVRVIFYSTFSTISGLDDETEYELQPHSGIRKETDIICRYRGEYEVGIKKVIIQDFLRLFTVTYMNREPLRVTVKPNIIHLSELKSTEAVVSTSEQMQSNMTEADVLVREYVPGDNPRFISWKVSGAAGKLMVRERTGQQQREIGIIMDPKRYGKKKEEYLRLENKMLETVIALVLFFSKKNIPVCFYHGGDGIKKQTVDARNFDHFYDLMCDYSFREEYEARELFWEILEKGGIFESRAVFFVIHKWDETARETALRISDNNIPVIVYVISDEAGEEAGFGDIPRSAVKVISAGADLSEVM